MPVTDSTAHGARRFTSQHYAAAIRSLVNPTELRGIVREIVEIAKDPKAEDGDRIRAADFLVIHTKGRPGTAAPTVDPLDLPTVKDARSALLAYGEIIAAVSSGKICADSAKLYAELVRDAASIARMSSSALLSEAGGGPEFFFTDDRPFNEQLVELRAFFELALERASKAVLPLATT